MKSCALLATLWLVSSMVCGAETPPKELLASGHVDEVIQTLQGRVAHSSGDGEAYNLLCRAYFMLDEWDRGISDCERAVKLEPGNSSYHLWLGRVYGEKADRTSFFRRAGMAKKVRMEFERAVELSPASWEARTDLAEFYLEAPGVVGGGKDKARAQAQAPTSLNPALPDRGAGRRPAKNKNDR